MYVPYLLVSIGPVPCWNLSGSWLRTRTHPGKRVQGSSQLLTYTLGWPSCWTMLALHISSYMSLSNIWRSQESQQLCFVHPTLSWQGPDSDGSPGPKLMPCMIPWTMRGRLSNAPRQLVLSKPALRKLSWPACSICEGPVWSRPECCSKHCWVPGTRIAWPRQHVHQVCEILLGPVRAMPMFHCLGSAEPVINMPALVGWEHSADFCSKA